MHIEFKTFAEYVEGAERIAASRTSGSYKSGYDLSFYGTSTFGEAITLAKAGWPEGWARMQLLREATLGNLASRVQKSEVEFRVAGGAVNVGRYLTGRPDCFQARRRSHQVQDQRSRKILRIVVNTGARAYVSADALFMRGAVALTLIEALERSGLYRVQVDMVSRGLNRSGTRALDVKVRLKDASDKVQLDTLAFVLAHPALHRRITFAYRYKHLGCAGGSVQAEDPGDIYIDAMDENTANWSDPTTAKRYLLARLSELGIKLAAAA